MKEIFKFFLPNKNLLKIIIKEKKKIEKKNNCVVIKDIVKVKKMKPLKKSLIDYMKIIIL